MQNITAITVKITVVVDILSWKGAENLAWDQFQYEFVLVNHWNYLSTKEMIWGEKKISSFVPSADITSAIVIIGVVM